MASRYQTFEVILRVTARTSDRENPLQRADFDAWLDFNGDLDGALHEALVDGASDWKSTGGLVTPTFKVAKPRIREVRE